MTVIDDTTSPTAGLDQQAAGARPGHLARPATLIAVAVACILFFSLTSPKAVPSFMLIAGFVVLGVLLLTVIKLGLVVTGLWPHMSKTYRRVFLVGGTALPVMLLMLQSIGQLTVRDILTLCGLFFMGLFYVSRVTSGRS